jgi:HD-GYP domain-containing protein (c-di-GMP phosphodiesterase class II)
VVERERRPPGLRGEQIALPARLARVAAEAARFCDIGGVEVTIAALRRRSGGVLDPAILALLHDLGRVGVSNAVWEKPGPLTTAEWEQVRMHPYHSERILATSSALEPLAELAGMHHERLDGSGYHRGCAARDIPAAGAISAPPVSASGRSRCCGWSPALEGDPRLDIERT